MSLTLLPLLTRGALEPLDPICRGDSRAFRFVSTISLVGAAIEFRLWSTVFQISKAMGSGISLDPGDNKVALIEVGGSDWSAYPDSATARQVHHIELRTTIGGRVETVVKDLPIVIFR